MQRDRLLEALVGEKCVLTLQGRATRTTRSASCTLELGVLSVIPIASAKISPCNHEKILEKMMTQDTIYRHYDNGTYRSVYVSLVAEIKHLKSLCMTRIAHINHGQNLVSVYLAKYAKTVVLLGSGLPEVIDLCKVDCTVDA